MMTIKKTKFALALLTALASPLTFAACAADSNPTQGVADQRVAATGDTTKKTGVAYYEIFGDTSAFIIVARDDKDREVSRQAGLLEGGDYHLRMSLGNKEVSLTVDKNGAVVPDSLVGFDKAIVDHWQLLSEDLAGLVPFAWGCFPCVIALGACTALTAGCATIVTCGEAAACWATFYGECPGACAG